MTLEILTATPDTAPDLARVRNAAWRSAYEGLIPSGQLVSPDDTAKAEQLAQGMVAGTHRCLLLRMDGRAAGMCTLHTRGNMGEIKSLYLLAEHWNTGAGSCLLASAEDALRQSGCRRATLWTPCINTRAIGFYARRGYISTGATKAIDLGGPQTAVQYGKAL